jgi:hypothetical protein
MIDVCNYLKSPSLPCTFNKYSFTHIMIWSLKVPLITWWRRSSDNNSWILVRGKLEVNGCRFKLKQIWQCNKHERLTTMSAHTPKLVHNVPGSQLLMRNSVFWWFHSQVLPASKFSGFASHLHRVQCCNKMWQGTHFGHHPWTMVASQTCSG